MNATDLINLPPDEFRRLAHAAVELIAAQLTALQDPQTPVRAPVPESVQVALMHTPLPDSPTDPAALLDAYQRLIAPYPMGNNHPRFMAWVNSTAAPFGLIAELLGAALNPSVAGGDHGAVYAEHGVLNWIKGWFGYPETAGGILASGGSVANLIGLGAMRYAISQRLGINPRRAGIGGVGSPLVVYQSAQTHICIQKAVELLGIGTDYLRTIPVDSDYRIDLDALRAQIAADRAAGLTPACVVGNAGTVNTGAIDPLAALADLCAAEGLWFHVDGAYGGVAILAEGVADHYTGIERADSIAADPHKWLYIPIECGCALVRDAEIMRAAFSAMPPYVKQDRGLPWFFEFGIEQTRSFRALKLWMVLQQVGLAGYRALISRDIALSHTLRAKIAARRDFQLVAGGPLSICCFVYAPENAPDLDALNREIISRVQAGGEAFLTGTILNGRYVLRACHVNFRTTEADLEAVLNIIAAAGQAILTTESELSQ